MCIRIKQEAPTPQKGPPAIQPRVEKDTSVLPNKTELVKPDDEKGVEFGSSKKQGSCVLSRAKGTEALRIPLNTGAGGTSGAGSGGVTV